MWRDRTALAGVALLPLGAAAIFAIGISRGVFLIDGDDGARWLVATPRTRGVVLPIRTITAGFRRVFATDRAGSSGALELRAVERASVWLDGEQIHLDLEPDRRGRTLRTIPLPALAAGEHTLTVYVAASASPPALWIRSDRLPIATDARWEFSWTGDPEDWRAAKLASDGPEPFPSSRQFPHAGRALWQLLPLWLPLAVIAFIWDRRRWRRPMPAELRWGLLAFWFALAVNNIGSVSPRYGMDLDVHLDYVRYLIEERRVPLATEGREMMHPPLAYALFAPLYVFFSRFFAEPQVVQALRVVTFVCAAAQVELCYRAARSVYPNRPDLQRVAILVGGLLPINLYLAHAVANEIVAALFGGALTVAMLRWVRQDRPPTTRELLAAGLLLGLALLSKVTTVFLAPGLVAAVALRSFGAERSVERAVLKLALLGACAALVAGWYYARNFVLLGAPFVGSWRPDVGTPWWQEPGYRSAAQYLRFGEALAYPVLASIVGLWDGLYSTFWLDTYGLLPAERGPWAPPWNLAPYLASPWLSLAPSLALALGALRALRPANGQPAQRLAERLAAGTVALYVAAILYLHLTVPFYCIAKGSYLAATTPLLAVLAASGFEAIGRSPRARGLAVSALACWAANVVATYWVL